jgi:3,4-dihydroxy 2-butanone 4-phosphate synthase/GTP cyclohydrolase II
MGQSPRYGESVLPTPWGEFRVIVYRFGDSEAVALSHGTVRGASDVLVRVHSECLTGEVFYSQRCDCRRQLDHAFERIGEAECGIIVYLRQEGRGIGLGNKIRAYALQDEGQDTVEANLALGFAADLRSYEHAAIILDDLGPSSIQLLTNNPAKRTALEAEGIIVTKQLPHWVGASEHNAEYLAAKRTKMGHK